VVLVVNEITPESRAALQDDYARLVISTPLQSLCRQVVDMMIAGVGKGMSDVSGQRFLQPDLFLPESV
ncbi:MAG: LacI family transcriptional regulator, partial [Sneathiella sp.]